MLNGDGICVGIQVRKSLVFRDPAAVDFVGDRQLTGLIVHFDDQVLAKILECDLLAQASALQPDFACPLLERVIMGDAALESDGVVLGAPRRFTAAAGIAALAGFQDRKSTRLNSGHPSTSYAVFCLKKKSPCPSPGATCRDRLRLSFREGCCSSD